MPTASQIAAVLEEMAPLHYQESYDNAGFCVGNPQTTVTAALLCVDVTEAVLDEAIAAGANLIISHHPVIFKGLKQLTGKTYTERIVEKALKNNLTLYAAHTNADSVRGGVSEAMADKLGLVNRRILDTRSGELVTTEAGFGMVGDLPRPLAAADFLQIVKKCFGTPCLRYSQPPGGDITRVAVCGGSGASLLPNAVAAGATAFVTADCKYHDFFDADQRLMLVDAGHYETEEDVLQIFYDCLTKKMPTFAVHFAKNKSNAVNYYK